LSAQYYQANRQDQLGIKSYKASVFHNQSHYLLSFYTGLAFLEINNVNAAVVWLNKAIDQNKDYYPAYYALSTIHKNAGNEMAANKIMGQGKAIIHRGI